jgi:hypothetical protein
MKPELVESVVIKPELIESVQHYETLHWAVAMSWLLAGLVLISAAVDTPSTFK